MYTSGLFQSAPSIQKERHNPMPTYLVQASYTTESVAALIKSPQNRTDVVRKMTKQRRR